MNIIICGAGRVGFTISKLLRFMSRRNPKTLITLLENSLQEKDWFKLVKLLLIHHYDATYDFSISKRKGMILADLKFDRKVEDVVDIVAKKILSIQQENY